MMLHKQHTHGSAAKRTSSFLQPRAVVSFLLSLVLVVGLYPASSYAGEGQGANGTDGATVLTTGSNDAAGGNDEPAESQKEIVVFDDGARLETVPQSQGADHLPDVVNATVVEEVEIGTDPLNLIMSGDYDPADTPAVVSDNATTVSTTEPNAEQRSRIEARLNTALMNVSSGSYNGQSDWCIVDVSDLVAPLSTNATAYTKALVERVINGNPDIFYAGASYGAATKTVTSNGKTVVIISKVLVKYYYAPSSINGMKTKFNDAMNEVIKWVNTDLSEAEQAKAVHDWLVRNCKYNYDAYLKGGPAKYGKWDPWSAYGAVVNRSPVCEGYSLAFMAAMQRLGIEATFVTNAGHGWNRVKVDGHWYNLDITYDDPLKAGNNYADGGYSTTPSTKYFLISDAKFKKFDTTHAKWSPTGVASNTTTYDNGWSGRVYPLSNNTHTVTSLSVSPSSVTLADDDSVQLTIRAGGSNVNLALATWKSSNTSVATVSSNGVVSSGTKTGTATITVTLGSQSKTCTVTVRAGSRISGATVSLSGSPNLSYVAGTARRPALTVALGGKTLTSGTDYTVTYPSDCINPGVKTVTITGKGNYTGTTTFNYTVTAPLSMVSMASVGNATYNGAAQKKAPTLTFKGSLNKTLSLKEGTDYTVTYPSDITNVGTKTVKITGRGAYTGTKTYTYKINALSINSTSISYDTSFVYTGSAIKPQPTIKVGSSAIPSSNYTLSYKNNVNVGSNATMTIVGKGNVTGSKTVKFSIVKSADDVIYFSNASTVTSTAIAGTKTGWQKVSGKWYYKSAKNKYVANGWQKISGKWYYFNASGHMQTGWLKYKNKWYYLSSGGAMVTGWQKISKKWYYFAKNGVMASSEYRDGYWINASGTWTYKYKATWRKSSGKWWFGDKTGWYAKNASYKINGVVYRFDKAGWCLNP